MFGRRAAKRRGGLIDKSHLAGYFEISSNLFWAKLLTQFRPARACGAGERSAHLALRAREKTFFAAVKSVFFVTSSKGPKVPLPLDKSDEVCYNVSGKGEERVSVFPDNLPDS